MFSDLSPREFRDHLMKIGGGLVREQGDEEALAIAMNSFLIFMKFINDAIDEVEFNAKPIRKKSKQTSNKKVRK